MVLEREERRPEDPWQTLPIDFLIKVLRDHDLPISTLVECRSVCKMWKEIIDGPNLRSKIWNTCVIFYDASTDNTAYFCSSDRWITRNITFEPKQLVAADGGLLCFNELLSTEYVMYNPVPDKFLTLNVPHEVDGVPTVLDGMLKCMVVGLVVDQSTKNYKLLLGGVLLSDRRRSLIYDSTTSTWSWLIHPFPTLMYCMEVEWRSEKSILCNGCLYWLVWDPRDLMKALLIFDMKEETWDALVEQVMEDTPGALQIAAYEGRVCLLAMDWFALDGEFDRWSYDANFLRHPMVRRMDGALIRRTRHLWDREDGRAFKYHAAGGSDAFFVFDEEGEDLEVAKYWAELGLMFFLPEPPFRAVHEFRFWRFLPHVVHDPWCAIIPTPGVSAEQWITQQQRYLQEEVGEAPRGEEVREAQGGEEVEEAPRDEEVVEFPREEEQEF